jgi:pSer/pThr/pTyr-binding forkhead associated (FHA) protein
MSDEGTRLETEEDVRRALDMYRSPRRVQPPVVGAPLMGQAAAIEECPPLFRPTLRPDTPLLIVCDDGSEEGETIRIRKDRFVIGRTEGDLTIGNDSQISSRHAELRQALVRDKYRWTLVDLKSTNGTYVRVGQAVLKQGQEFLLGSSRFRFEDGTAADAEAGPSAPEQSTRMWQAPPPGGVAAIPGANVGTIVALSDQGDGARVALDSPETWLGRDAARCKVAAPADRLLNARHARIRRQQDGRWILENNKSVNGVWLRMEKVSFTGVCRFMLGEQRFTFRAAQ